MTSAGFCFLQMKLITMCLEHSIHLLLQGRVKLLLKERSSSHDILKSQREPPPTPHTSRSNHWLSQYTTFHSTKLKREWLLRPSANKKWIESNVKRLHKISSTFLLSFLSTSRLYFLEWGDFHVHSRVSRDLLYIPGEKWGKENVCIY